MGSTTGPTGGVRCLALTALLATSLSLTPAAVAGHAARASSAAGTARAAGAEAADLALRQSRSPDDPVFAGTELTYTLTAVNLGPGAAERVRLEHELHATSPGGHSVRIVSAASDRGTCAVSDGAEGKSIACELGPLAAGEQVSANVVVALDCCARPTLARSDVAVSSSAVLSSTTPDPVEENNGAAETTYVFYPLALHAGKQASAPQPLLVGTQFEYEIFTAAHCGSFCAVAHEDVVVVDRLPPEVDFLSAAAEVGHTGAWGQPRPCAYAAASRTVTCELGRIVQTWSGRVRIAVRAVAPGEAVNEALSASSRPQPGGYAPVTAPVTIVDPAPPDPPLPPPHDPSPPPPSDPAPPPPPAPPAPPAAPPSVTVAVSRSLVVFGDAVVLSGVVSTRAAGETVGVRIEPHDGTPRLVRLVSGEGGAWQLRHQPRIATVYTASLGGGADAKATVGVRPRLELRKVARDRFAVTVVAARSLVGRTVTLARWLPAERRWSVLRHVTLARNARSEAVSVATVRVAVPPGTRLRAFLTQAQAGPGYAAGHSNVVAG